MSRTRWIMNVMVALGFTCLGGWLLVKGQLMKTGDIADIYYQKIGLFFIVICGIWWLIVLYGFLLRGKRIE